MTYTKFPRGSEWRKWDLHIHTPETKKNDSFTGSTPQEKWTNYIESINSSTEDISVIGITDYFSIENYFKFKSLVGDGSITKKFDLIIPNIELRVLPVTGSSTPINLHCIFNPEIDLEITNRFLSKLDFHFNDSNFTAHPDDLRRLGRSIPGKSNLDEFAALRAGVGQYVVEIGSLRKIFQADKTLRDNTIIVVSNKSTDGVSGVTKHVDYISEGGSQLDVTRYSIYQFSDALFSSSEKDVLYFTGLGADAKDIVIEKCKTLMPCFHGCDAHSNDKIFKPDNNRFCWIKADPTFEGLRQTLYEPADRVRVQAYKPDVKNDRYIISELQFLDSGNLFGNKTIQLNENLNSIIGGKSSGKSLLMYSTARSVDPKQVDRLSQRLKFEGYKFNSDFDFKVIWKNGEVDTLSDNEPNNKIHKITYIPQLYINHLVERNNKEDLNKLIEGILLQDADFRKFSEDEQEKITQATNDIDLLLNQYLQIRSKGLDIQQKSREIGKSESLAKSAASIQSAITAGQKASNLSEAEFADYNRVINEKSKATASLKELTDKENVLNKILSEVLASKDELLGEFDSSDGIPLRGKLDRVLDQLTETPKDVEAIILKIKNDFDNLVANLKKEISTLNISTEKARINASLLAFDKELKPYLEKIAGQKELQKLTLQLQAEQLKQQEALNLEKQLKTFLEDYKNLRSKIVVLLKTRYDSYKAIVDKININRNDIGTGISLNCSLLYKQENFSLFEQINKAAVNSDNLFYSIFSDGLVNYEEAINLFEKPLKIDDGKLTTSDGSFSMALKNKVSLEEILRGMVADNFILDFTVSYKGDDLLSMSPGKKGTVLLILFLQISSSEFPILIDQPEDNLDNRTIYDLLCKMIKIKKQERQIIIVSHNANLVIATDSENIIVANQEGQDTVSVLARNRFEYVSGSLEHSFTKDDPKLQILLKSGIKEHSCDILEGGDEAFKQREKKYSIK